MAYATTVAQPILIGGGIGDSPRLWMYSAADTAATVDTIAYFTDGYTLGMRAGDLVLVYNSTIGLWTGHAIATATSTGVDLRDGTTLASTANTD